MYCIPNAKGKLKITVFCSFFNGTRHHWWNIKRGPSKDALKRSSSELITLQDSGFSLAHWWSIEGVQRHSQLSLDLDLASKSCLGMSRGILDFILPSDRSSGHITNIWGSLKGVCDTVWGSLAQKEAIQDSTGRAQADLGIQVPPLLHSYNDWEMGHSFSPFRRWGPEPVNAILAQGHPMTLWLRSSSEPSLSICQAHPGPNLSHRRILRNVYDESLSYHDHQRFKISGVLKSCPFNLLGKCHQYTQCPESKSGETPSSDLHRCMKWEHKTQLEIIHPVTWVFSLLCYTVSMETACTVPPNFPSLYRNS